MGPVQKNQSTSISLFSTSTTTATLNNVSHSVLVTRGISTTTITIQKSTGNLTKAEAEAALDNLRYNNTSDNPTTTSRSFSLTTTDQFGASSDAAIKTISVVRTNDPATGTFLRSTETSFTVLASDVDVNDTLSLYAWTNGTVPNLNNGSETTVQVVPGDLSPNAAVIRIFDGFSQPAVTVGGKDLTVAWGTDDLNTLNLTNTSRVFVVYGFDGNDNLTTSINNDTVYGGLGDDTITGGRGADLLVGGAGSNTFVFTTGDSMAATAASGITVTFSNGVDLITDFKIANTGASDTFRINSVDIAKDSFATAPDDTGKTVGNAIIRDGNYVVQLAGGATDYWYVSGTWDGSAFTDTPGGPDYLLFQASPSITSPGTIIESASTLEAVILKAPDFTA